MLNEYNKQVAIAELEKANNKYIVAFKRTISDITQLFQSRQRAIHTILKIESYISSLANKPRDYERKIGEIKIRYLEFKNRIDEIKRLDEKEYHTHPNLGMGTTVLAGAGAAAFAPSVAIRSARLWNHLNRNCYCFTFRCGCNECCLGVARWWNFGSWRGWDDWWTITVDHSWSHRLGYW